MFRRDARSTRSADRSFPARGAKPVDIHAKHDAGGGFRVDRVGLPVASLCSGGRVHLRERYLRLAQHIT